MLKEIEINFAETHCNICNCASENHDILKTKINYNILNDEINGEIEEIKRLSGDYTIQIEEKKDKILKLIKDKDNDTKLKIISSLMNMLDTKVIFYQLDYDDEIFSIAFSCLKENKNYSSYNIIMNEYMSFFFYQKITLDENSIFTFDTNYTILPALYYYNPNFFSYSFYFQVYRKKIMSDIFESHKAISFLRKKGISNDIICSHLMNLEYNLPHYLFVFGFFSLECILNLNADELSKFKQNLSLQIDIICSIIKNQLYEIFFDFLKFGKSNRISLLDKSNHFSKLLIENILDYSNSFIAKMPKSHLMKLKNLLNNYLLFMFNFLDENKIRKVALLSSFSLSQVPHQNIFDYVEEKKKQYSDINKEKEYFKEIFDIIDDKVNYIIKNKKTRKNDSLHNISIIQKLLEIYNIRLYYDDKDKFKIEELYYDFNELLQNIIENNYPTILANKIIQILKSNAEESKKAVRQSMSNHLTASPMTMLKYISTSPVG